jgi:hypothetical protein
MRRLSSIFSMAFAPRSEEEVAQAITRLVDGPRDERERAELEAWASERPDVLRQVAAQRRVAEELGRGGPEVPARLLEAVEAKARSGRGARAAGPARRSSLRWRPLGAAGAFAILAAAIAVVVIVINGTGGAGSINAAARLAYAPSTGPAPSAQSAHLLDVSYAGVTYPNYARLGTVATGQRSDRIDGRPALTVFYRLPDGVRMSYTVFSGRPVPVPVQAKTVIFEGVPLQTYATPSGLAVVTLVRSGRTCVLSAPTRQAAVLALAAAPVLAERA